MANTGVTGRVVDDAGNALPGLKVQVYDVEFVEDDVLLGSTTTSASGDFRISYPASAYGLEEKPDLKLVISDPTGRLLRDTREYPDVVDPLLSVGTLRVSPVVLLAGSLPGGPAFRKCCLIGFSPALDVGFRTDHSYGGGGTEEEGYIYTCGAGFLDLAHLHDLIDLTYYYFKRLTAKIDHDASKVPARAHFDPWSYSGRVKILNDIPESDVIAVARSMAYDHAIFHEIYSYWVRVAGMHSSSFSPEDLVSNWLGTYVAGKAIETLIRSGGNFEIEAGRELGALLTALEVRPLTATSAALAQVTSPAGKWFTGSILTVEYLQRRNFTVRPINPWVLPGFAPCLSSSGRIPSGPSFDLPLALKHYYQMTLDVEWKFRAFVTPTTMKSSEFEETGPHIDKIKTDARKPLPVRYGPDFDKPV